MLNVLVSHIDLDGYGCEIVGRHFMEFSEVHHVNYDELASELCYIDNHVHLWLTDLSIPEYLAPMIDDFDRVTIIDHHVSTYWANEHWAGSEKVDCLITKERCATYLFATYLVERGYGKSDAWLKGWIDVVDDYDRYLLKNPKSERLNALLYISNRDRFVADALIMDVDTMVDTQAYRIDNWLKNRQDYMDSTIKTLVREEPRTYLVYAERHKSKMASDLIQNENADLVFIISLRELHGSIRSSKDSCIDSARIANIIDPEGGGHLNASGFAVPQECILQGFQPILDMVPWDDIPRYDPAENEE